MNKTAILTTIKLALFSIILMLCALILNDIGQRLSRSSDLPTISDISSENAVIIIDAGHGGEDPGAIGINKCIEKDINLKIALSLYELLKISDIPTVLTRDKDVLLYKDASAGHKKSQDLKTRLEITESYDNAILVSIHMNSYPSSKYSGVQVYYSQNNDKSSMLAEMIQNTVCEHLQPENTRETKGATSAIYLLHHTTKPAVLVECGFISNMKEAELLITESYQRKMALSIYCALNEYISK